MKEEEFGPIEQDIVKEEPEPKEAVAKTPKPSHLPTILAKLKTAILSIKKPKAITLIILTLAIALIYLSLNLLGHKQQEKVSLTSTPQQESTPQASLDPTMDNIAKRVELYGKKIDALDSYKKQLTKPIVNLEISFEE